MDRKMKDITYIHNQELNMLLEIDRIAKKHNIKYFLAYGSALGAVRHSGFIPWDTDTDIIVSVEDYDLFIEVLRQELSSTFTLRHIIYDNNYDSLQPRVTLKDDKGLVIHVDIFLIVGAPKSFLAKWIYSKVTYFNQRLFFVKNVESNINYKNKPGKRRLSKMIKALLLPIPNMFFVKLDSILKSLYPIEGSSELYNLYGNYGMKEYFNKEWLGNGESVKEFEGYKLPIPEYYDEYLTNIYGDYMTPRKDNYI